YRVNKRRLDTATVGRCDPGGELLLFGRDLVETAGNNGAIFLGVEIEVVASLRLLFFRRKRAERLERLRQRGERARDIRRGSAAGLHTADFTRHKLLHLQGKSVVRR